MSNSRAPKKTTGVKECVSCKWTDTEANKSRGPLIKPCKCPEDKGYYHYICLGEIIMKSYDAPCRGCDQKYTDSRIERNRGQYYEFVSSSRAAQGLLLVWLAAVGTIAYKLQNESRDHRIWLAAILGLISGLVAVLLCVMYGRWLSGQDRRIWFANWKRPNVTGEYNVTQSKKSGKRLFVMWE